MVKLIEKITAAQSRGQTFFSFEVFPPKSETGCRNLVARVDRLSGLQPLFVDVTWGSGGSTSQLTLKLSKQILQFCNVPVMMHLTCTNMTAEDVRASLSAAKAAGLQNILALRGDPPKGTKEWKAGSGGFQHAIDLVRFIRAEFGDFFGIAVGGYPEGWSGCGRGMPDYEADIRFLKEKVDAGADFVVTQLFYDPEVYFDFVEDCRAAGITCPIIPGVMPIQNFRSFTRMVQYFKCRVPKEVRDKLEPIKDDDAAVKAYGVEMATSMCRTLLRGRMPRNSTTDPSCSASASSSSSSTNPTPTSLPSTASIGLHFYTLNLERSVRKILSELELTENGNVHRQLPWRQSSHSRRENEDVRPIFWANRPKSYLARTQSWDEFPNGRWGDSASPAFGELSDTHFPGLHLTGSKQERLSWWGDSPLNQEEIFEVFARYVEGKVPLLPWCESGLHLESGGIKEQLARLNRGGLLTINSQPAVNGLRSDDPVYGWGPTSASEGVPGAEGFVYQKAYIEFFASPLHLRLLIDAIEGSPDRYSSLVYHASDVKGNTYTNSTTGLPCAVTWGVFPGKEVQQPTVVDPSTFLVWKDEAFDLWISSWASIYDEDSRSYNLVYDLRDSFFLINIVDNDFVRGDIFAVFEEVLAAAKKLEEKTISSPRRSSIPPRAAPPTGVPLAARD